MNLRQQLVRGGAALRRFEGGAAVTDAVLEAVLLAERQKSTEAKSHPWKMERPSQSADRSLRELPRHPR